MQELSTFVNKKLGSRSIFGTWDMGSFNGVSLLLKKEAGLDSIQQVLDTHLL